MNNWLIYLLWISCTFSKTWQSEVHENSRNPSVNLEFTLSNKRNPEGQLEDRFSMDKMFIEEPNWKVHIQNDIIHRSGQKTIQWQVILSGPPTIPADYELFEGIGYYKLHKSANGFNDASATCAKEGGHLVIINSEDESGVLQTIFKRHPYIIEWAFIGCHDKWNEGIFVTIYGEPLKSTGFSRWFSPSEPNGGFRENCCTVHRNGGINDGECHSVLPFFCEYDLSWNTL